MRGKCVKARNDFAVQSENKYGCKVTRLILSRLPLKIGIQRRNSAEEGRPVVIRSERLDFEFG